ncbi:hypothetical protein BKA64DRAFT_449746 [Cadophora sp. MPI-SDFR-AT-0126]|nr:hypothetical protein BKA64DRAFT_449746 [Leotiomycetes sp. MPI-SDFR-AT-0126]
MKLDTMLAQMVLSLLALSLLLVDVAANAIQNTQPPQDVSTQLSYPVTPMKSEGTINGIPVNTSGSVEDIYAQAAKNPLFAIRQNSADTELVAREKAAPTKILGIPVPGQNWQMASQTAIEEGIRYLRSMIGYCTLAPQNCHRVSRSWGSGIYVCNDNAFEVRPLCSTMGAYAQEIMQKITRLRYVVGGQAFGM